MTNKLMSITCISCSLSGHSALIDSVWSTKGAQMCMSNLNQGQESSVLHSTPPDHMLQSVNPGIEMPLSLEEIGAERPKINLKSQSSLDVLAGSSRQSQLPAVKNRNKSWQKMQEDSTVQNLQDRKSSTVFKGKIFCFSNSFPEDRVRCRSAYFEIDTIFPCNHSLRTIS